MANQQRNLKLSKTLGGKAKGRCKEKGGGRAGQGDFASEWRSFWRDFQYPNQEYKWSSGKAIAEAREKQREKELRELAEQRRKQKEEDAQALKKIREQVRLDKSVFEFGKTEKSVIKRGASKA